MNDIVLKWLLECKNPAIKYRTTTELLGKSTDKTEVISWIKAKIPPQWQDTKGLWYIYYVTALTECGLSYDDDDLFCFDRAFALIQSELSGGCADFMLLTALVKLGFGGHEILREAFNHLKEMQLSDGGFLCDWRKNKLTHSPKSCYKSNLFALLLTAECHKKGIAFDIGDGVVSYFLERNLFFTKSKPTELVIDAREGWRTIDTFYPFEVMRMGIQNVVEAFSALGYGNDKRLNEAWQMLYAHQDADGKFCLKGTLTKSYLPKEKVGNPSKWVTFYALLAEKHRDNKL